MNNEQLLKQLDLLEKILIEKAHYKHPSSVTRSVKDASGQSLRTYMRRKLRSMGFDSQTSRKHADINISSASRHLVNHPVAQAKGYTEQHIKQELEPPPEFKVQMPPSDKWTRTKRAWQKVSTPKIPSSD